MAQMALQAFGSIIDSSEPTVKSQEQWYMFQDRKVEINDP